MATFPFLVQVPDGSKYAARGHCVSSHALSRMPSGILRLPPCCGTSVPAASKPRVSSGETLPMPRNDPCLSSLVPFPVPQMDAPASVLRDPNRRVRAQPHTSPHTRTGSITFLRANSNTHTAWNKYVDSTQSSLFR